MGYSDRMDTPQPPSRDASAEDILSAVTFEIDQTETSSEKLGKEKLRRSSSLAVDTLLSIMLYDSDNKVRLQAAKEVLDRVYGTGTQQKPMHDETESSYKEIFEKISPN